MRDEVDSKEKAKWIIEYNDGIDSVKTKSVQQMLEGLDSLYGRGDLDEHCEREEIEDELVRQIRRDWSAVLPELKLPESEYTLVRVD